MSAKAQLLDMKVYGQLVEHLTGTKITGLAEQVQTIETRCTFGHGREVIRELDKFYQYEKDTVAARAAKRFMDATCSSMKLTLVS